MTTTLATRVQDRARRDPGAISMREKEFGIWREVSWSSYWESVLDVAHGLLALGVETGDRVAIQSENRREWLYADIAVVAVRAATVGLYATNPSVEVGHILSDSGARILVAEDQEQVDKALALDSAPELERIIYLEPRGVRRHYDDPRLMFWADLLELGQKHRAEHPDAVERRMAEATRDDLATLVYTSGTTGPPKGAMVRNRNIEFAIQVLVEKGGFTSPPPQPDDLILSYLPLCHIAERIFSTWFNAGAGVQVNFAESIETVPANLREVQPTILFGVPRIWEKLLATVSVRIASASPMKRALSRLGLSLADRIGRRLADTGGRHTVHTRLMYAVGWVVLFHALRDRLGVRKVRYAASGAAPVAPEVLRFFMGIGVPMHEVYGMTENTGIATANRPRRIRLGTVGEPHVETELRIDEATGEILTRSNGTFAGYWRNDKATGSVVDDDGWLHTGDVGEWVDGTHVLITDRMKDIIITSGGKNVSPSEIENAIKASPYVKEAIVLGDSRPYLTALIGIELDTVADWAQRRHVTYTTYRDLSEKPEVLALLQGVVDGVNQRLARVEQVKRFTTLPRELDHQDGDLTATQKVKRAALGRAFGDLIESMYLGRGGAP